MFDEEKELPKARPWPEPLTLEQYQRYTPEKLELIEGYLIDGPESTEAREQLLALLLTNVGLEAAVQLAYREDWLEAIERSFSDGLSRG